MLKRRLPVTQKACFPALSAHSSPFPESIREAMLSIQQRVGADIVVQELSAHLCSRI